MLCNLCDVLARFGDKAGWAHSLLFAAELPAFLPLLPESLQEEVKAFRAQEKLAKAERKSPRKSPSKRGTSPTKSPKQSPRPSPKRRMLSPDKGVASQNPALGACAERNLQGGATPSPRRSKARVKTEPKSE